ncbi:YbaB/EbfC family nucleoid-associated protein [Nocardia higoensis]|uniref:YbaB/EbfC family nucleoid-associated protein n=1 Tax=Nocardia higoensis TaxID=228599 RepID=A0ABS0DGT5_9NOCA|nr:YbaB/EbfC family nucleoid-associated protein [Nocardia higoensis]MBF6356144.1 YbaB/EbfC family nucleoid-associated protein [Nocardia higoensis]
MPNEFARQATSDILDGFAAQMRAVAAAAQQRAELTATAFAQGKRVKVTVNADGVVLETRFSAHIGDLTYDEIARAVTAAAQDAAEEAAKKVQALVAPINDQRARMPKLSELIDDLPDLESQHPDIPPASTVPLSARKHAVGDADSAVTEPDATGIESAEEYRARWDGRGSVTDQGW